MGSVEFSPGDGSKYATVLNTIKDGEFIFKITYSHLKKVEIEANHDDAPWYSGVRLMSSRTVNVLTFSGLKMRTLTVPGTAYPPVDYRL